tara:strand:+ start:144 stop:374 length:231 start_codon:yes stop_codon:yes gene_type:complete
MEENYLKIKAKVVLSDMPVDIELEVEDKDWIFADSQERAVIIWNYLYEKYPVNMKIALNVVENYPSSSYVYSWEYN